MQTKETGVNKIVGVDKETESQELERFNQMLNTVVKLPSLEHSKSVEFLKIYEEVISKLKVFFSEKNIRMPDFPIENVYLLLDDAEPTSAEEKFIKDKLYNRKRVPRASFVSAWQRLFVFEDIWRTGNLLTFASIVHELIHFTMFNSWQKEGNIWFTRRMGLEIDVGGERYFQYTNEFVTESLASEFEHRFFPEIDVLKQEYDTRNNELRDMAIGLGKEPDELTERLDFYRIEKLGDMWRSIVYEKSYYHTIKEHNQLIDHIYEVNKDEQNPDGTLKYKSRDDIWNLFVQSAYTGKILDLARLIEKTYGKGAFRLMGENTK